MPTVPGVFLVVPANGGAPIQVPVSRPGAGTDASPTDESQAPLYTVLSPVYIRSSDIEAIRAANAARKKAEAVKALEDSESPARLPPHNFLRNLFGAEPN